MEKRESTLEVLKRLKSQEGRPMPEVYRKEIKKEEPVKIVNIPQRNVENLLHKMEELERKMKNGTGNYFGLYHELNNAEQVFLKEAQRIKQQNFQIPEPTMNRVNSRLSLIESRRMRK